MSQTSSQFQHALLGIDIAKDSFTVRLLKLSDSALSPQPSNEAKLFPNNNDGYRQMSQWLTKSGVTPASCHVVLESTSVYWEGFALFCHEYGFAVSLINL